VKSEDMGSAGDRGAVLARCRTLLDIALVPGKDPFDALAGTLVPKYVKRSVRLRQAAIQLRKRSTVDLSVVLGVRPFIMAKALGCFLASAARVESVGGGGAESGRRVSEALSAVGRSRCGPGWGYEFDVQTRWGYYPAGSPNLIATVFVARGLLEWFLVSGSSEAKAHVLEACEFVLDVLCREQEGGPAFLYTADSSVLIHNANALGAGLLAAGGRILGRSEWVTVARAALEVTLSAQRSDGSWAYGEARGLGWSDSFHTAYVLDGMNAVSLASGGNDSRLSSAMELGADAWMTACFGADGTPFYYTDGTGPFDIHSAATAIDVMSRCMGANARSLELARRVYRWTEAYLLNPATGLTYYQTRGSAHIDKRNFRRWGDAHFALGCSALLVAEDGRRCPIEAALVGGRE
jgi:hypothetical protein